MTAPIVDDEQQAARLGGCVFEKGWCLCFCGDTHDDMPCHGTHFLPHTNTCVTRDTAAQEAAILEEEVQARVTALVEARVKEVLASSAVQESLQQRLEQERAQLESQVAALLEEEARQKELQAKRAAEAVEAKQRTLEQQAAARAAAAEAARREEELAAQQEAEKRLREVQQRAAEKYGDHGVGMLMAVVMIVMV